MQYSVLSMLVALSVAALLCAALIDPCDLWADGITSLTMGLLLYFCLLAIGRPSVRPFCFGFLTAGCMYFLLVLGQSFDVNQEDLLTDRAIHWLSAVLHKDLRDTDSLMDAILMSRSSLGPGRPSNDQIIAFTKYVALQRIGHCGWTLVLATIGGLTTRWLHRSRT